MQYNIKNSKENIMISLLIDSAVQQFDVLVIQKLWRNACVSTSYNSFNIDFHLTYHSESDIRICFYVNTKLDVNKWSMYFSSEDVCTLKLKTIDDRIINIHNVYSSSSVSYTFRIVLVALETMKSKLINEEEHILLDDFNLHHSMWEEIFKSTQHDAADQLIDVVLQTRMQLTLSTSTIIWEARHLSSTIDLMFMISWLVNNVISCETRSDLNQSSNHISILITLTLKINSVSIRQKRAWKRVDVEKLRSNLRLFITSSSLSIVEQIEVFANLIQSSIHKTIDAAVSWARFVPKSKSHWNQKCVDVVLTTRRKRRVWSTMRTEQSWQKYLRATNEKKKIIARKKKIEFRQTFRFFINSSSRLWRLVVWAKNKSHKSRKISKISALTERNAVEIILETIEDFAFKTKMLHKHFFSNTTETNLSDLQTFIYRSAVAETKSRIQKNEIRQAIKRCKSDSVSELDDISNKILKILCTELMLSLMSLFRVCVELNYHSRCFRIAHIIALKKLNKKDYFDVKTYKFIALLNTLNKTLKSIIARRISSLAKTHDMLFASQMSDRKSRSCETTLKLLIEQIHTVWNMKKDKIATLLSMNVIDVYDHVFREKLLHNLRKRDISNWIIRWTDSFMKNRHISLTLSIATMTSRLIKASISQRSFISSILYLFYNADLLKVFERSSRRVAVVSFVNDINLLTYDIFTEQNCRTLKHLHKECETWNRRHDVVFASIKYELVHLARNHRRFNMQVELRIEEIQKSSAFYVRVLDVQMNSKLKWKSHIRAIQEKMITQMLTLSRLTTFTWEACFARARLIYSSVIRSAIIYESSVWYASHERSNSVSVTTTQLMKMQKTALRIVSKDFRVTSLEILKEETHIQFIHLHLSHLQVVVKNRLIKHEHRTLIEDFCNRIKSRLVEARERRRQREVLTSNERKQQWYEKLREKLFRKNRAENTRRLKVYKKIFNVKWKQIWAAYQTKHSRNLCLTLTDDITVKRLKLHEKLTKSESSLATQIRTNRIELTDYFFSRKVSNVVSSTCFCDWIRQNVKHIVLQCFDHSQKRDNMLRKDDTTNFRRFMIIVKNVKTMINWFMKTSLLEQFSLTTKLIE